MKLIIVGYGWSGSSAIIDYLYDKGLICGFYMDYPGETKILNYAGPVYFKMLNVKHSVIHFNMYDFVVLISGGRYGLEKSLNKYYHKKFFRDNPRYVGDLLNIEEPVLVEIIKNSIGVKEIGFHDVIENYNLIVDALLNKLESIETRIVTFNNDAHIYRNDSYYDLTDIHKILVYRNPLDQFTDRYIYSPAENTKPYRKINLVRFILIHNIKLIVSIYKTLTDKKLKLISFERFLFDENEREKLFDSFYPTVISNDFKRRENRFFLEKSRGNIGLYKTRLTLVEITLIYLFSWPLYKLVSVLYRN